MTSLAVTEVGRIGAVAGQCQRDLQRWVARYPDLFASGLFDPTTLSTVSLVHSVSLPGLPASVLRPVMQATLWAFALDRHFDEAAVTEREIRRIGSRCRAVAGGQAPGDGDALTVALADVRDAISEGLGHELLGAVWRREVSRVLAGMAREWRWRQQAYRPTVDEYLANADNLAFCFIFATHAVGRAGPRTVPMADRLMGAGRAVQRVVRVLNDLGTHRRDLATGDLNVLELGESRSAVRRRLRSLTEEARRRLAALPDDQAELAQYLDHHIDFNLGFYAVTDYWGRRVGGRVASA
jgi:hypothetical protein